METKKISELEQLDALTDVTNVIVEDGGTTKRFPATNISRVKTVNRIEPDKNGNVAIDIPEGFSGSWDDLTDKPFYVNTKTTTCFENVQIAEGGVAQTVTPTTAFATFNDDTYRVYYEGAWNGNGYAQWFELKPGTNFEVGAREIGDPDFITYPFYIQTMGAFSTSVTSVGTAKVSLQRVVEDVAFIDERVVPDTIARSASSHGLTVADAAGDTPTAAEFNAMLATLRSAGYLAQ